MRDSGILHALLGPSTARDVLSHPKAGASWEGFAIEETLRVVQPDSAYFWATHTGAELDLLLQVGPRRYGVEMKFQDAPRLTLSMRISLDDLRLDSLTVLYPGDRRYELPAEGRRRAAGRPGDERRRRGSAGPTVIAKPEAMAMSPHCAPDFVGRDQDLAFAADRCPMESSPTCQE